MTDLSNGRAGSVSVPALVRDLLGANRHLLSLLWQAWWREGDRSREAVLTDGTRVPMRELFSLDGTTLCVPRGDGTMRRIPASMVDRIVVKDDPNWGD